MDIHDIGQHMMSGFQGVEVPEAFAENVKRGKIGNVILFESNVAGKEQLCELCGRLDELITSETGERPLIAIDQEGGAVSRLKEDATVFPSAMAIAAGGDPSDAYKAGLHTGRELRAMGVNYDLAPVMDVNSNPMNPVIGVRSYGDSPEAVSRFGTQMMMGLRDGGVLSALKHFPGHGDTAVDSHLGLPTVDKSLDELERCELAPFRAGIEAGAPAVMTTHILFPKLEPDGLPATMSRRIITGLLRERMGYEGLIITDCLMMGAIVKYYGTIEGVLKALRAGVDLTCVSHDATLAREAIERVKLALEAGELYEDELKASTERIAAAKRALNKPQISLSDVGSAEARAESARMTRNALTLVKDAPFSLGERPMFLGCLRFRATMANSPEDASFSFSDELKARFGGGSLVTPQDPTDEQIAEIAAQCAGHSSITLGLYNGAIRQGQIRLARAVAALGIPVCLVSLRSPYDLSGAPDGVRAIAAYDYDRRTINVIGDALSGAMELTGRLPVKLPQ